MLPGPLVLLPIASAPITSFFDKVAFDLDTIGRRREIARLVHTYRQHYEDEQQRNINIAVWNMHLNVEHDLGHPYLTHGISRMGNGGGFVVVVFEGGGWIVNKGKLGDEDWVCYGKGLVRKDGGRRVEFRRKGSGGGWLGIMRGYV